MTKPERRKYEKRPSQYFIDDQSPAVTTDIVKYAFRGITFTFETGSGIFSKERIDTGSEIMLQEFCKHEQPEPGSCIMDLGCGYGFIGIVLGAVFPDINITFIEINGKAMKFASRNVQNNGIRNVTMLNIDFTSDAGHNLLASKSFDYILFNPPVRAGKNIMENMIRAAFDLQKPDGVFYIVIKTSLGAKSWQSSFESNDTIETQLYRKGGYRVFKISRKC
ncbi:MAG TPA: methyltransferase [Candidatus Lokiarchaeia archaeon]|nr:methyltransferase [Candidatus Lokiarchaeia archaeon]